MIVGDWNHVFTDLTCSNFFMFPGFSRCKHFLLRLSSAFSVSLLRKVQISLHVFLCQSLLVSSCRSSGWQFYLVGSVKENHFLCRSQLSCLDLSGPVPHPLQWSSSRVWRQSACQELNHHKHKTQSCAQKQEAFKFLNPNH